MDYSHLDPKADDYEVNKDDLKLEHTIKLKDWNSDRSKHHKSSEKAYTMIKGYCKADLFAKIEQMESFESEIENNPIALIRAIRTNSQIAPTKISPWAQLQKAQKDFTQCFQEANEPLFAYKKRMRGAFDAYTALVGKKFLKEFIINTTLIGNQMKELALQN